MIIARMEGVNWELQQTVWQPHKKGVRNFFGPALQGFRSPVVGAKKVPDPFFVGFMPWAFALAPARWYNSFARDENGPDNMEVRPCGWSRTGCRGTESPF
jgi:hypothetical protein